MLNSTQRAKLKSIASTERTPYQIGKGEIDENYIAQINEALEARELIKIKVLPNSMRGISEIATVLSSKTKSEIVQIIGAKIILYRKSSDDRKMNISQIIRNL